MFKGFIIALLIFLLAGSIFGFQDLSRTELIILLGIVFLGRRVKEKEKGKGKK